MGCVERTLLSAAFGLDSAGPFCKGKSSCLLLRYYPNVLVSPHRCIQRAPTNGAGAASRAVLVDGHTSALTHRSITIVADGRLEVCDGDQRMFVMKKGSTQLPVSSRSANAGSDGQLFF